MIRLLIEQRFSPKTIAALLDGSKRAALSCIRRALGKACAHTKTHALEQMNTTMNMTIAHAHDRSHLLE